MYGRQDGDTWYYSHPGCSIDPNPKVLQKLNEISDLISQQTSAKMKEQGIEAWHKVCRSPQQVRIMGIPFDTRFAHVMVQADYDMKKLADGSDTLDIKGFVSSADMTLEQAKYSALLDVAEEELRTPEDQLYYILRQELERRGKIPARRCWRCEQSSEAKPP